MLRLEVTCGDRVLYLPLPIGEGRVGSSPDNELVLPFPGVSRHHALFRPADRGLVLIDSGSKNGLVLGGKKEQQVLLEPGGVVRIGSVHLTLEEIATSDAEVALALDSPSTHSSVRKPPGATDGISADSAHAATTRAFRFVRTLESLDGAALAGRRPELFGEAASVVGAETLITFRLGKDGLSVSDLHGALPEEQELEALLQAARLARQGGVVAADEWLVVAGANDRLLAALIPRAGLPIAPWKRAFFEYLGGQFVDGATEQSAEPAGPGPDLVVPPGMILGPSPAMQALLDHLRATVRSRLDVLLLGETGTGKELFARLIHASGPTANGPFVAINCAAIPGDLLEAELFGILGRVATNVDARLGLLVQAKGGTVFLDEIGDMPEMLQSKLLRVLQEREVVPVGGTVATKINVRVVSASNRSLPEMVQQGAFRADLYYRLRGLELRIPPLRERREDIPPLALVFASRAAKEYGKRVTGISRKALGKLVAHPWPGNVRELESTLKQAVLLCPHGGTLESEHLNLSDSEAAMPETTAQAPAQPAATFSTLQERVDGLERESIAQALAMAKGRKGEAAKLLGLSRQGLLLKMKRLGIG